MHTSKKFDTEEASKNARQTSLEYKPDDLDWDWGKWRGFDSIIGHKFL